MAWIKWQLHLTAGAGTVVDRRDQRNGGRPVFECHRLVFMARQIQSNLRKKPLKANRLIRCCAQSRIQLHLPVRRAGLKAPGLGTRSIGGGARGGCEMLKDKPQPGFICGPHSPAQVPRQGTA